MEQTVVSHGLAHKLTQIGSATAVSSGVVGWLTENYIILTSIGVAVGVAGVLVGTCLNIARSSREKVEHKARMDKLLSEP